jgi:hypothetical protein
MIIIFFFRQNFLRFIFFINILLLNKYFNVKRKENLLLFFHLIIINYLIKNFIILKFLKSFLGE